jgi:PAS domain S-box-containing protein
MERQQWLTLLLNEIQEAFLHTEIITDHNGKIVDLLILEANAAAQQLLGKKREEIIGKTRHELLGVWMTDEESAMLHEVVDQRVIRKMERHLPQNQQWLEITFYPSLSGKVSILSKNITAEKLAHKKSIEQERKIRQLIEHTPAAVAMLDRNMRYLIVSNRWMTDYQLENESIIGKSHYDVFPNQPTAWHALHERCLQGESFHNEQENYLRANGSLYCLKWELSPWYSDDQEVGGIIIFSEIVPEKGTVQQELDRLNASLEEKIHLRTLELEQSLENEKNLGEMKSRFVSMASHEFRTPLTSMLSSIHLLEKYAGTSDHQNMEKHTHRIKSSIQHLVNIMEGFLTVDKLESGKNRINIEALDMGLLSSQLLEDLSAILKKGQSIRMTHDGSLILHSDAHVLKSILINLLSNAIKYSPEDTIIEFHVNHTDEIILEIKDQGIGIPEADQPQIFSKFFRAGNTGKIPGTGLGLNIVQRYVELLGGEISMQSEENVGTCFRVRLPSVQQ